jgi:UDP-N-acetylmuramoylalanine-D-glutamate ligase
MIPVRGYTGCKVAVLGLGRSGLTAARALRAGGAEPIVWDDNEKSRIAADAEDFVILDLNKNSSWQDIVCLIVSPGIPHLYPAPHPIVLKAWQNGVVVDNDIDDDGVCDELEIVGCIVEIACNYNPEATDEDALCLSQHLLQIICL